MALSSVVAMLYVASLIGGLHGHEVYKRQGGPIEVETNIVFDTINNITACGSAKFTWFHQGPQANMALSVTNIGVPRPSLSTPTIDQVLSETIIPANGQYQWTVVDVPAGNYRLVASIPSQDFKEDSAIFHVVAGPDTSCLGDSSPPPSSNENQTPPSSSSPKPSPSNTPAPVSGAIKPRVNTGTIVGIALGVVALLIACIAVYFFLTRRRSKSGKQGASAASRKWNGLSSTDSRNALGRGTYPVDPYAVDPIQTRRSRQLSGEQRRNQGAQDGFMMTRSEETIDGGASEEKFGGGRYSRKNSNATTYDDHDTPLALAQLPTLHHNPVRDSPFDKKGRRTSYSETSPRERRNSKPQYPPHLQGNESAVSRSSSVAENSVAHHSTEGASTSNLEPKKAHRNSIGGRKRKPVPTYDPNEIPLPSTGVSPSSPSISPFSASPLQPSILDHESTMDHHSQAHYTTRNQPSRPGTADGGELLAHKSSFGAGGVSEGKLHYLIPDMPVDPSSRR